MRSAIRYIPILWIAIHLSAQTTAYVPQVFTGSYVSDIDLSSLSQQAGIALPNVQNGLALTVSLDSHTLYVACALSEWTGAIEEFDIGSGLQIGSIPLAGASATAVVLSPDGTKLVVLEAYGSNLGSLTNSYVELVDLVQQKVSNAYSLGDQYAPGVAILDATGNRAYVNFFALRSQGEAKTALAGTLLVDFQTGQISKEPRAFATNNQFVAYNPNHTVAYLAALSGSAIETLDLTTLKPVGTLGQGIQPTFGIAVSPDGSTLYSISSNRASQSGQNVVQAISVATGEISKTTQLSGDPSAIALRADGAFVLITTFNASTLLRVDAQTLEASPAIPLGNGPNAIAVTPDGSAALISNYGASTIQRINVQTRQPVPAGEADWSIGLAVGADSQVLYSLEGGDLSANYGFVEGVYLNLGIPNKSIDVALPQSGPEDIYIASSAKGGRLYASANGGYTESTFASFDFPSGKLLNSIVLPAAAGPVVISPDDSKAYISGFSAAGTVFMAVDLSTFQVFASNPLSVIPGPFALDAERNLLCFGFHKQIAGMENVYLGTLNLEAESFQASYVATVPDGVGDSGSVVLSADGAKAYLALNPLGEVAIIDRSNGHLITALAIPGPAALAATPDGTEVWVLSQTGANGIYTSQQIVIINIQSDQISGTIPVSANSGPDLVIR